jgi:hypothetical protein
MKYPLLVALSLFILINSYGQTDSAKKSASLTVVKIYSGVPLKRGFYRNYKEYITNSPSPPYNFTVDSILHHAGTDSIFEYKAVLQNHDSVTRGTMRGYGFCDGNAVYLAHGGFVLENWKTDCIGPNPFYTVFVKTVGGIDFNASYGQMFSSNDGAVLILTFKTRGNPHEVPATPKLVRRVMRKEPDLITSFMQEVNVIRAKEDSLQQIKAKTQYSTNASKYKTVNVAIQQSINDEEKVLDEVMKKYLLLYNQRMIEKGI